MSVVEPKTPTSARDERRSVEEQEESARGRDVAGHQEVPQPDVVDQQTAERGTEQEAHSERGEQEADLRAAAEVFETERHEERAEAGVGGEEGRDDHQQGSCDPVGPDEPEPGRQIDAIADGTRGTSTSTTDRTPASANSTPPRGAPIRRTVPSVSAFSAFALLSSGPVPTTAGV
jgi:hypothetical protein